ncbi:MAG: peptide ABC transporter substrate-binding protein [Lachnospiraceae bacterium]|nr:peptide ABC transporter substrate-binding protein [Lachnospiraceae bacterium]
MKKRLMALLMSVVMIVGLAACGGDTKGNGKQGENVAVEGENAVYRILYSSEIGTMNYLISGNSADQAVAANTVDTLIDYDSNGTMVPGLAESWSYDEVTKTWTFNLRADQKWLDHTGAVVADVTAQDFVDAMKYVLDPANLSDTEWLLEGVILNATDYYAALSDDDASNDIKFEEVGVKAVDALTLQYTLEKDVPYFLSMLGYVCFMPAYGPLLEETGIEYATAEDKMYYCGAYYMANWEPQVEHRYVKNPNNWDADNVFINEIVKTYNAEASTVGPEMAKRGEIDYTTLGADIVDSWMNDPATKDMVSMEREDASYSYFYCFNFNVYKLGDNWQRTGTKEYSIDEKYEPWNWEIAVNNENFRQSIMSAVNRANTVYVNTGDYANPADLIMNTITPTNNIVRDGKDAYTTLDAFKDIQAADFYNADEAVAYRDAAIKELTAAGATFPVKMLVRYNPSTTNWEQECIVLEQQVESVLGKDYVDVIIEAGPSENYLSTVRRSSDYMFMKCNWGGDYADPETWVEPFYQRDNGDGTFHRGGRYAYLAYAIIDDTASADTVKEYFTLVEEAKAITGADQEAERFEAFAKAEAYLIEHALAVPYGISTKSYIVNKLDVFESQYSPSGVANSRYKGMKLYSDFISMDEYNANTK